MNRLPENSDMAPLGTNASVKEHQTDPEQIEKMKKMGIKVHLTLRMAAMNMLERAQEGYTLRLYLENRSETDAVFSLENVTLNGQSSDPDWIRPLGAEKKFFVDLYWSDGEMAALEIAQVLSVQMELVMCDESGTELARQQLDFKP